MNNRITVSVPGKLMLLGEHTVVYNHPCLVTAVDQRMRVTVEALDSLDFQLEAEDVKVTGYKKLLKNLGKGDIPKGAEFVEIAVKNTLELNSEFLLRHSGDQAKPEAPESAPFKIIRDSGQALRQAQGNEPSRTARMTVGVRVVTKSELSPKLGFGSSSAVTVCVVKGLSELLNIRLSQKEIFDLSYKTVLDIQGKGSGFDVAAAVFGGTLYFVTGGKAIEPLKIDSLPLVVGYSGIKADTVTLINKVKESFANKKNRLEEIYNSIEMLVDEAKDALIKMDWKRFGTLMNKNQEYLRELGVSIDKLDNMITAAISTGAYGAKLSGAGGGDCMIALASEEKRESVKNGITQAGGEIIDIKTNAEGVKIEQ